MAIVLLDGWRVICLLIDLIGTITIDFIKVLTEGEAVTDILWVNLKRAIKKDE